MAEPTAAHARELGDYMSLARRRWIWIAGCLVAGLALALAYLATAQATYVSTSKVLVLATGSDAPAAAGARTSDTVNLDTEAQLVTSDAVSERAKERLGSTMSTVALARQVTVTVVPNTTVLVISFAAPSADEAQRGAATFARAYLEYRQDTAQEVVAADVDRLQSQIEQTTAEIEDTSVAISRLTGPGEQSDRAFLVARRTTLSTQLASYNTQLAPLVGATVDAGQISGAAQKPSRPVDPNPMLILPTGLMGGLVVGLGLAAWRERRDRRVHHGAEIERLFGIAPLAALTGTGRGGGTRVAHGVRALYHLLRAQGRGTSEVVLLVGADTPDAAEHLAYSLAIVAARSGSPTAYVTRPQSPVLLDRRRTEVERSGALRLWDYQALGVMPDGEFRSANLHEELRGLATGHDFLILGLPNNDPEVDLPILGRHVDVAVLVVQLGVTTRDAVAAALVDLTKSGVDHVVVVTVDLGRRAFSRSAVPAADAFSEASGRTGPRAVPEAAAPVVAEPSWAFDSPVSERQRDPRDDPARASARRPR